MRSRLAGKGDETVLAEVGDLEDGTGGGVEVLMANDLEEERGDEKSERSQVGVSRTMKKGKAYLTDKVVVAVEFEILDRERLTTC